MSFEDLTSELLAAMPDLRGKLKANVPLAGVTWFRVGGPAQLLFNPADEVDLAYFLKNLPSDIPVITMGLASNLIVRDGGIPGCVIRMMKGFGDIEPLEGHRIKTGTAASDARVARAAADAEIDGLAFYRGIPGGIGGALRMNAGAHGTETKDILIEARAVDRKGNIHVLANADMGYSYRHCSAPDDYIFTEATFQGKPGNKEDILAKMDEVAEYREEHQPVKSRTGGSTFKNPEGNSSWKLIDAAGCRGLKIGGAQVSEKHCNFLLNVGEATAHDIEKLGETVRARVKEDSGITLKWEIKRLGIFADGQEPIPTI